ncbi:MAG: type II methionyl aminopeptidase [archaeon]
MESEEFEAYLKAGRIASAARASGYGKISVGASLLRVAEFVESEIVRLGGSPAFPTNISTNSAAAHYTPRRADPAIFKDGDVVKLDLGVSVNGFVADTAVTKVLSDNPKHAEMKIAAGAALAAVGRAIGPGVAVSEIGAVIEEAITSRGFKPIYNLTGHLLKRFDLHAGLSVPNYRSGRGEIPGECAVAIEPFATDGDGYVENGAPSEIYLIVPERKLRLPIERELFARLRGKFSTLPFTSRWVPEEDLPILKRLVLSGAAHNYPVLQEKSGGVVAQAEHTFLVSGGKVTVTTA